MQTPSTGLRHPFSTLGEGAGKRRSECGVNSVQEKISEFNSSRRISVLVNSIQVPVVGGGGCRVEVL